jgi:DNA-binding MarR family transcriptional regulator
MANTLARMERDGLIERRPSPTDRRARLVFLTDRARGLQGAAMAAAAAANRQALSGLSAQEQAVFIDLMARVIATMQRQ